MRRPRHRLVRHWEVRAFCLNKISHSHLLLFRRRGDIASIRSRRTAGDGVGMARASGSEGASALHSRQHTSLACQRASRAPRWGSGRCGALAFVILACSIPRRLPWSGGPRRSATVRLKAEVPVQLREALGEMARRERGAVRGRHLRQRRRLLNIFTQTRWRRPQCRRDGAAGMRPSTCGDDPIGCQMAFVAAMRLDDEVESVGSGCVDLC